MVIGMRTRLAVAASALLALLATLWVPPAWPAADPAAAQQRAVQPLRDLDVPGWTAVVVQGDRVVARFAEGRAGGRPVSGSTPFLVGSVSKSFTATLVLNLVQEGQLGLDDRVDRRLPDLRGAPNGLGAVSVRQLLTHTSGLSRSAGLERADVVDDRPETLRRLASSLREVTLASEPGTTYAYSDANYLLLGAIVEQVTGTDFGRALRERVTDPLGMSGAITTSAQADASGVGAGNRLPFGRARPFDRGYSQSGVPYGYVGATPDDLVRYARFQLGVAPNTSVLSSSGLATMQRAQVRTSATQSYGFGWRTTQLDGLPRPVVEHTGATPGFFTHVLLDPANDRAVIVLANAYSEAAAPALAGVGPDLLRAAAAVPQQPMSPDPVLSAAPWVAVALAAVGLVCAALAVRAGLRRDRRRRAALTALAVLGVVLAALAALTPRLVGYGWREVRLWAPDLALGLGASVVAWGAVAVTAAVAVVVRTRRGRAAPPG
ncbi:CubicO group peptidase (beta-lactamase class C family) [Barrientosiimonas humi]|uniref:CubicO group peptidase (Beta-lactamase class C family) n=2 Tax=Barrientosiimonas humi TaxID=999931 RepID=A0A542XDH3_9MICO|nr:CubicO group peptidase (beta-lactamase class C family) [Barrientosiimonas humi]CAG7573784.1 D-alanyl-D-alanine carboxypeptidase [Barrientosiimonas humi]